MKIDWVARMLGKIFGRAALYALAIAAAVLATVVIFFAFQARLSLPELQPWHRIRLAGEYRAGPAGAPGSFADYLSLEKRLIADLRERVLENPAAQDAYAMGRFHPGSVPGRLAYGTPYNRSYELTPAENRGAVLLVHGLSDSPYSMRALADFFFERGFYVLSLRLPGHGTIPAGLLDVRWRDWYAAVQLAMRHAASRAGPGKPFYAAGYSTGAALLTLSAVRSLADATSPRPERMFLFSAAIGVTDFAVLTNFASALSFLPFFEKSKWLDLLPEYDPYKYNSFTVNAANQIYSLTRELERVLIAAEKRGELDRMPRILAFQSIVDSTVTAADVVRRLLIRLPARGHELVAFDVNRSDEWVGMIAPGPREMFETVRKAPALPFRLTFVTNRAVASGEVAALVRDAGSLEARTEPLGLSWPEDVFSLGHLALTFAPDDPVYGLDPKPAGELSWTLGRRAARGEEGATVVPLGSFARLRSNPFFEVVRSTIRAAIDRDLAQAGTPPR